MSSVKVDELNQTGLMERTTYKEAGVDLDTYRESMSRLPQLMHRTYSPRVIQSDGGFAGLFQMDFTSGLFARSYEDPVLVAGTDGVGTKLKVASLTGKHDTVGIDLVAMCVNDVICCGAEPLFFLDYVAMSHDNPDQLEQIVTGISNGCVLADCSLLGGETAIMPDLYQSGDYDLAGFCVGIVEKDELIDGSLIEAGDVVIGVASSGLHSNGFSLVRKIVLERAGLAIDDPLEEFGQTVGEILLTPTRIWRRPGNFRFFVPVEADLELVDGIVLVTGRSSLSDEMARVRFAIATFNSGKATSPVDMPDDNPLFISRELAQQHGITDGDQVRVTNNQHQGSLVLSAVVSDRIHGETIYRSFHKTQAEIKEGVYINDITSHEGRCPYTSQSNFKLTTVTLEKVS